MPVNRKTNFLSIALLLSFTTTSTTIAIPIYTQLGVNSEGALSKRWMQAIGDRHSAEGYLRIKQSRKQLTSKERDWYQLIESQIPPLKKQYEQADLAFPNSPKPKAVTILCANQGGDDGFTYEEDTIALDLSAWQDAYGNSKKPENSSRILRILTHEYTHLLTKLWMKTHPVALDTPFNRALFEAYYEGLGTYWSLSEKWVNQGQLTPLARETLSKLKPILYERLKKLRTATTLEEETALRQGLSKAPFSERWGSLTVALKLAEITANQPTKLADWVALGPNGVLRLFEIGKKEPFSR